MLNDPETAHIPLRYFQGRRDITVEFDFTVLPVKRPVGPLPARISERSLFTPDARTFCCEITPSLYVEVLNLDAEWDEEPSEELREWWDELLMLALAGDDDYYVHYRRVVAAYEADGPVTFAGWFTHVHEDGEFDAPEDAREYAQGNWHV
jgi:hypothetical protein